MLKRELAALACASSNVAWACSMFPVRPGAVSYYEYSAAELYMQTAYNWDPGAYLSGVPASAILGVEAPLWTETITKLADIEFMAFPRLAAIAELGWSPWSGS